MRTPCVAALLASLGGVAVAAPPAAPPGAILVLERARPGGGAAGTGDADERALVDALRIYTRDLGCQVLAGPGAPAGPTRTDVAKAWERGRVLGAELVLWLAGHGETAALIALRVDDGRLHTTPVAGDEPDVVARTLALKVRALYPQARAQRPSEWTPLPAPPADASTPSTASAPRDGGAPPAASSSSRRSETAAAPAVASPPASPPPPTPVAAAAPPLSHPEAVTGAARVAPSATAVGATRARRSSAPAPTPLPAAAASAPSVDAVAVPAAPRNRPVGLEVGAGFAVDVPTEPSWSRLGASLRLALVWNDLPLALQLDGAITSHASTEASSGSGDNAFTSHVEIWDLPLGLALTYRLSRGRLMLAAGPRVSLHIIHASADADASCTRTVPAALCNGSRYALSVGPGVTLDGRVALIRGLWLALTIGAEALLPRQTFSVATARAADLGAAQVTLALGLVWRAY